MRKRLRDCSDEEIRVVYEGWDKSKLGQRAYCQDRGLSFSGFKARLMKGRKAGILPYANTKSNISKQQVKASGQEFVRVSISDVVPENAMTRTKTGSIPVNTPKRPPFCEIKFEGISSVKIEHAEELLHLKSLINALS